MGRRVVGLMASLTLVGLAAAGVRADTASELKAARARLASAQAELGRLAARYDAAQATLARTEARLAAVQADLQGVRSKMARISQALAARARAAYESGGTGGTVELLLTSSSFAQFSDRVEFLGRIASGDTDLISQAAVTGEALRRDRAALGALTARQSATVAALAATRDQLAAAFARAQSAVADLQARLAREQAAAARLARSTQPSSRHGGGGALQACPVGQPRVFGDDFGAPRPGGRTHQGIDMLAPLGTPIYAAQTGRFEQNYNDLGGISGLVYADNGDTTYYAHMSSYAGDPSGAHEIGRAHV